MVFHPRCHAVISLCVDVEGSRRSPAAASASVCEYGTSFRSLTLEAQLARGDAKETMHGRTFSYATWSCDESRGSARK